MSFLSNLNRGLCEYDIIEDDSDQERGKDSSEDELEILLHGTMKQKRKLTRSISRGSLEMSESSEDEFDKEMDKELDETMRQHEQQQFTSAAAESVGSNQASCSQPPSNQDKSQPTSKEAPPEEDFYSDIYFDSDDEKEEASTSKQSKKRHQKRRVLTNDELLYDPDIDDQNQEWVNKQRQKYYPNQSANGAAASDMSNDSSPDGRKIKDSSIPQSDAVLNCPACLTTLCLDCQRHELYTHQYRAMFVLNCSIIRAERLKYSVPQKMGRKWRKKHKMQMETADASSPSTATNGSSGDQQEYFHPVRCSKCNTEVAVYDSDEVYHFFNVLTSLS
ncbi:E2F-associated phosphoprotein-like isoform X1 [Asterias amurensis]|uniref:E2F-associated phosphoprotein-like isoform X1 n=1 Tax=Asterias amurensis TaxID=7602 RepID=UPI003AB17138